MSTTRLRMRVAPMLLAALLTGPAVAVEMRTWSLTEPATLVEGRARGVAIGRGHPALLAMLLELLRDLARASQATLARALVLERCALAGGAPELTRLTAAGLPTHQVGEARAELAIGVVRRRGRPPRAGRPSIRIRGTDPLGLQ